ncbi:2TM domain-containing protein [Flavobacterium sp.]|uniref:2TM domain-containing protein n=1 Tax=Flavobacterium sp. TaxID=239 RepID=UPI0032666552
MMESDFFEAKRYHQARKKVKEMRMFYEHLTVFILVSIILIVVNFMTSPECLWFIWCWLGGVTGVIIHGLQAFGISPVFNADWEERKILEILEKNNNKNIRNNEAKL